MSWEGTQERIIQITIVCIFCSQTERKPCTISNLTEWMFRHTFIPMQALPQAHTFLIPPCVQCQKYCRVGREQKTILFNFLAQRKRATTCKFRTQHTTGRAASRGKGFHKANIPGNSSEWVKPHYNMWDKPFFSCFRFHQQAHCISTHEGLCFKKLEI